MPARSPSRSDELPPVTLGTGGIVSLLAFLAFLGFPLSDLFGRDVGAGRLVLVLAGVAAFVAAYLYVMLFEARPRRVRLGLVVMAVLALAVSIGDRSEWASMFIYVAAACGMNLRQRDALRTVAACAVAAGAVGLARHYPGDDVVQYVIYAIGIGALLQGFAKLALVNAELHAARDEIARLAVGEERLRFARDLHDLLGHSLSVIALKSELARRLIGTDGPRAEQEVAEIEQVSRAALVEVREAVSGYRRMTLAAELRGAEVALQAAGIEPEISRPSVSVAPEVEAVLAWAVREGTTNVIRHSGARRCAIRVHAGLADAGVEIVDDGAREESAAPGVGSGLAGLQERVRDRHGRLEVGRRPEGGFRLAISVPAA
jgi:two-component system sensor histidine kinase DesK